MRYGMRVILTILLFFAGLGADCWAQAASAKTAQMTAQENRAKALELLDKYAATQDKLRSFAVKDVCKEVRTSAKTGKVEWIRTSAEFRNDGNRVSYRAKTKSNDKGKNNLWWMWLWDGEVFLSTDRIRPGQMPNVSIRNHDRYKSTRMASWNGSRLMGIMGNDIEPIASIMRHAKRLTLQHELEIAGKSKCYVVNAVTKYGKYTVWIDPQHDYHIARARVVKKRGDIVWKKPLHQKYERLLFILTNVRFEKIDNVWVPMEADYAYNFVNKGGKIGKNRKHYERIEIALNPDHDKLGSFVPDDILNGAKVRLFKGNRGSSIPIRYTWHDGKVVDANGIVAMDCRKKLKGDKK